MPASARRSRVQLPARSDDLRPGFFPNTAAILVESEITHKMNFVLDAPLVAVVRQHLGPIGFLGAEAGDSKGHFHFFLFSFQIRSMTFDTEDLRHGGELQITDQFPVVSVLRRGKASSPRSSMSCLRMGWLSLTAKTES